MYLKKLLAAVLFTSLASVSHVAFANTEKWIELHNRTGTTILNVFFSEIWSQSWSADALEGLIMANETKVVRIRSGACMIDMRVRYANNAQHELRFDICRAEHIDAMSDGLNVAR